MTETANAEAGTWESAVVLDIDRVATRAILLDVVDDNARFVGLSSSPSSTSPSLAVDVGAGIIGALKRLEEQVGRRFIDGDRVITPQQVAGDGADVYYVTGMPADPIRIAVIAVGDGPLADALPRALRHTMTHIADARVDLPRQGLAFSQSTVAGWLKRVAPSTVVMVFAGGSSEAWAAAIDAVAEAAATTPLNQGIVVADEAHQQAVAQALSGAVELSGIDPTEYREIEIAEAVETEMRTQYNARVQAMPGFALLPSMKFVDKVQATQAVVAFLHRRMQRKIIALSIGDGALIHVGLRHGATTIFRADRDLGFSARALIELDAERTRRWLPDDRSDADIRHWLLNRSLRPLTQIDAPADIEMAGAVERELFAALVAETGLEATPDVELIAVEPRFGLRDPARELLAVLDGVMPDPADGLVTVALDVEGLMGAAGTLSTAAPAYAAELIEQDCLSPLASCIVVRGRAEDGALAVRGEIRYDSGETRRFSVPFGSLLALPLNEGESANLTLTPEPEFSIGGRPAGQEVIFEDEHRIFGGEIGVVIDARGRPVELPADPTTRAARLRTWVEDISGRNE